MKIQDILYETKNMSAPARDREKERVAFIRVTNTSSAKIDFNLLGSALQPNMSLGLQHQSSPSPIRCLLSVTCHVHSSEILQHIIQPSYPCLLYTSRCV